LKNNIELIADAKTETAFNIYRDLVTKIEEFKEKISDLEHNNETAHIKNMSEAEKQHTVIITELKKTLDDLQKWMVDELHVNVYNQDGELLKNYKRVGEVEMITTQLASVSRNVIGIKRGLILFCSFWPILWGFVEMMMNNDRFATTVLGWFGIR
jgi:hypothetical protein